MFDGVDVSTLRGRKLKEYYGDVQGVFQDPFSSYNPIFKTDHVFQMLRHEYFAALGSSGVADEARAIAGGRQPRSGRSSQQVPASAERRPAPAHAHCARAPARHSPPRRRRDHQHARRLDSDRCAEPARRFQVARARHPLHHARSQPRQLHQRQDDDPLARAAWSRWAPPSGSSPTRFTRTRRISWPPFRSCTRSGETSGGGPPEQRRQARGSRGRPLRRVPLAGGKAMASFDAISPADVRCLPPERARHPVGGAPLRIERRALALDAKPDRRAATRSRGRTASSTRPSSDSATASPACSASTTPAA